MDCHIEEKSLKVLQLCFLHKMWIFWQPFWLYLKKQIFLIIQITNGSDMQTLINCLGLPATNFTEAVSFCIFSWMDSASVTKWFNISCVCVHVHSYTLQNKHCLCMHCTCLNLHLPGGIVNRNMCGPLLYCCQTQQTLRARYKNRYAVSLFLIKHKKNAFAAHFFSPVFLPALENKLYSTKYKTAPRLFYM